jgi:hypothetical protein
VKTNEELKGTRNLLILRTGIDGGIGELYKAGKPYASVIWSNGGGWEHVSIAPYKHSHTPTWDEMCALKDMFFYDEETVVQYHPPKSEYVNNMPNCLHLWRPIYENIPQPPSIMVGIKDGQTIADFKKSLADITDKTNQE